MTTMSGNDIAAIAFLPFAQEGHMDQYGVFLLMEEILHHVGLPTCCRS